MTGKVLGGELQELARVHVLVCSAIRNTRLSDSFLSLGLFELGVDVKGPIELRNGTSSSG